MNLIFMAFVFFCNMIASLRHNAYASGDNEDIKQSYLAYFDSKENVWGSKVHKTTKRTPKQSWVVFTNTREQKVLDIE